MSDLMLHGILNAPCNPEDYVGVVQLKVAARTASERIKQLEEENKKLLFMVENGLGWEDMKGGNREDVS